MCQPKVCSKSHHICGLIKEKSKKRRKHLLSVFHLKVVEHLHDYFSFIEQDDDRIEEELTKTKT